MSTPLQSRHQQVSGSASIGLIGAGRLGSSLALALARAGHPVGLVAGREPEHAEALAAHVAGAASAPIERVVAECELILLAVPDAAIAELAARLAWRSGQSVVHCSGAQGLEGLEPVRARGGRRGCFHPLQAFPERMCDPTRFAGIVCGVEADDPALAERLTGYALAIGATCVRLEGVDRARYHAAAVLASNYLVSLHALAAEAWSLAGLPRALARSALVPLTQGAAESIARLPLETALTGPIARGDADTVARHVQGLAAAPELLALYRKLGAALLALPLALDATQREKLAALLGTFDKTGML